MTSTLTIQWDRCVARRSREMKSSALRELLKLTSSPEMISFAGGLPAAELFPLDRVAAAVQSVLGNVGKRALQYGETEGVLELREWIAHRHSNASLSLKTENVLITTGAQQALDLAGKVLLDEGDRVIVENPTYMAALSAWRPYGAAFLPIAADCNGMNPDELGFSLKKRPKMLYLIPNFQNPTGVTMTKERRHLLIETLKGHEVALFEDDPYGELRYEGEPLQSLLELDAPPDDGGRVIQAGTFSKTLMPGLRIGWMIGPQQIIKRMARAKQAMDLHTSTFNQHIALALLNTGYLEEFIPILRRVYRERRDAMLKALKQYFPPGSCWTSPEGGMFIFVTLPEGISVRSLLTRALEQKVAFVPGEEFYLDGTGKNTMRLNFTKESVANIISGISRLGEVARFC